MGKDKRWVNLHKAVHREILKEDGKVNLPPNRIQPLAKNYNRKKFNIKKLLKRLDD